MKLDLHYTDPRLVALYDTDNPRGIDYDFYIQLAAEIKAQTILDLGCGTGLLTRDLATNDRKVIGVDPSTAMLAYARQGLGHRCVQLINDFVQAYVVMVASNYALYRLNSAPKMVNSLW